jgi:hypothetical protein
MLNQRSQQRYKRLERQMANLSQKYRYQTIEAKVQKRSQQMHKGEPKQVTKEVYNTCYKEWSNFGLDVRSWIGPFRNIMGI